MLPNGLLASVWIPMKNENYFIIQLIFATIYEPIALFGTIYGPHCIISATFYIYLRIFSNKFSVSAKISGI